ncbi:hypothetical protein OKW29_000132 [Paraburkholderia sp. CI3]
MDVERTIAPERAYCRYRRAVCECVGRVFRPSSKDVWQRRYAWHGSRPARRDSDPVRNQAGSAGLISLGCCSSLEASVTHAKRIGRSVFDPRVQLLSADVFGQPEVVAAHYENIAVCSVRIASDFERLAIRHRRVRKTGHALLRQGWSVHSSSAPENHSSAMLRFGLSRTFDADELSDTLLPYVGEYVS